jgi:MFS family permease
MEKCIQPNAYVEDALSQDQQGVSTLAHEHDNSPHNPLHWALSQKLVIMAVVGVWILLGTTNMIIIGPALPIIPADLNVPFSTSTYLVGGPLLAYGVASLFWVPLANRFGARLIYVSTSAVAMCFCIWGAKASTFTELVVARTLASAMFAPPETLAPQMVGDLWSVKHRATAMTWIGILQATGFSGGPLIGGFIVGNQYAAPQTSNYIIC